MNFLGAARPVRRAVVQPGGESGAVQRDLVPSQTPLRQRPSAGQSAGTGRSSPAVHVTTPAVHVTTQSVHVTPSVHVTTPAVASAIDST